MESLCGRYGIWVSPLFKVSPGFRRGIGAVEDASIYLRRYRGSQKLICSTMRVNLIIGKKSNDLSSAYEMEGSANEIS